MQNSHPLWHYVLSDHHIRRNPHFAPPDPRHQVVTPANPRVYPVSKLQKRYHNFSQSGRFTSACSPMIYRDDRLFDRGSEQHAFTCEPFHNLVQHNLIKDAGVSFTFRRDPAEQKTDFFASEDRWCRPVMARTGPDGALWVVDMYRYMIEHPQWLPQQGKDELRPWYRSGDDLGRIYRVVRSDRPARKIPRLAGLSTEQLVAALESPNGWHRDTAQRLLVHGKQQAAKEPLGKLATKSAQPLARLHALWTLDGLGSLSTDTLQAALTDRHPGIRRNAVRIAGWNHVDIRRLSPLVDDPDAKVRLELATTLGAYDSTSASEALAKLAIRSSDDPFVTAAVMSSLNPRNVHDVFAAAVRSKNGNTAIISELIGQAIAMGDKETIDRVINTVSTRKHVPSGKRQFETLARIRDALARRKWPADKLSGSARNYIAKTTQQARAVAADLETPASIRAAAIPLLGRDKDHQQDDFRRMQRLLIPQSPVVIQQAVVANLAGRSDPSVAEILLAGWQSHSPEIRGGILDAIASRKPWAEVLRGRLESGTIRASELSAPVRQRFLNLSGNSPQWQKALDTKAATNRADVLREFQPALKLSGDSTRGAAVFRKKCINCHKLQDEGHDVGPQLASITSKTKEALFNSILDPNAAVDAKYFGYTVLTEDGRSFSGKLETETGSSITLLTAEGKRTTVLRRDIEILRATNQSIMPEGLEQGLKPQDLADLIQFVRSEFLAVIAPSNRTACQAECSEAEDGEGAGFGDLSGGRFRLEGNRLDPALIRSKVD